MTNHGDDPIDAADASFASVALLIDWIPTLSRAKLEVCPPGTPEADYLALSMAFNNTRKAQMLFLLLAPTLREALDREEISPRVRELAARVKEENDAIDSLGQDYEAIAKRLERIVRNLAEEVSEEYDELLSRAAEGASAS